MLTIIVLLYMCFSDSINEIIVLMITVYVFVDIVYKYSGNKGEILLRFGITIMKELSFSKYLVTKQQSMV